MLPSSHANRNGLRQTEIGSTVGGMKSNRVRFATLDEEVSGVVRAEIARQRRDQKEIAASLDLHPNVFGRKVRGEVAFSAGELLEVAHSLGLSAAEITKEAEARFADRTEDQLGSALAATSDSEVA